MKTYVSATVPKTVIFNIEEARNAVIRISGKVPKREQTRLNAFYFYLGELNKYDEYWEEVRDGIRFVYGLQRASITCEQKN